MTEQTENNTEEKVEELKVAATESSDEEASKNDEPTEVEKLETQLGEAKTKYAYLAAELDNTQKRFERERENLLKYGSEKILKEMLEVVDNFERTVEAISSDEDEKVKNIVVGIEMVKKQLLDGLKKFGLEEVKALGETFDPNFHEAVAQESVDGAKEEEITKEYQKGYTLNGRLLRASKVVVNK